MTKYIVKNCPAYGVTTPTSCALTSDDSCEFTDCRIKKVVKICQEKWNKFYDPLAKVILQTMQVQEVE